MDETLGFFNPKRVSKWSLPSHLEMVKNGELPESQLPVFYYRRMTGEDIMLMEDRMVERVTDHKTNETLLRTKSGLLIVEMLKKYWVGAENFVVDGVDFSFRTEEIDALKSGPANRLKFEEFMQKRMDVLPIEFLTLLYGQIRFGSQLTDDEIKNSESLGTASSVTSS